MINHRSLREDQIQAATGPNAFLFRWRTTRTVRRSTGYAMKSMLRVATTFGNPATSLPRIRWTPPISILSPGLLEKPPGSSASLHRVCRVTPLTNTSIGHHCHLLLMTASMKSRLLTVIRSHRGSEVAALLMYAAFRWVESHGGSHIVAIDGVKYLDLYFKVGLADRLEKSVRPDWLITTCCMRPSLKAEPLSLPFRGTLARFAGQSELGIEFQLLQPRMFSRRRFFPGSARASIRWIGKRPVIQCDGAGMLGLHRSRS